MNYSGGAAEQVVRMTLEGTEIALKLTGTAAKHLAAALYAIMKDQNHPTVRGRERLTHMLKSGKALTVFTLRNEDLKQFASEAKRYGVVYCVLKGRGKEKDGMADILVRAEDASRINRIVERFRLNSPQNPQKARTGASPSAPMSGQPIGKRPSLREQIRKAKNKSASRILTEQER